MPHQLQNQIRIPPIRLLLARLGHPNLGRIAHPQLMPTLVEQPPEPLTRNSRFHAHNNRLTLRAIELRSLFRMQQLFLLYLTCLVVKDRNLLKTGVEIAAYNQHRWLLLRSSAFFARTDYRRTEPMLLFDSPSAHNSRVAAPLSRRETSREG